MVGLIVCLAAILIGSNVVGASRDEPISVVTVFNYKESPKDAYQIFFNEFTSNMFFPQCFKDYQNRPPFNNIPSSSMFNQNRLPFYDISIRDIFYNPIFVAIRSLTVPDRIDLFFVPKGFYSIYNEPQFNSVKMFILTPTEKSAVAFQNRHFFNFRMFNMKINEFVVSDDYSVGDFAKTINNINRIPIFTVLEKYDFEGFHFEDIYESGQVAVYENYVEPIRGPTSFDKLKKTN